MRFVWFEFKHHFYGCVENCMCAVWCGVCVCARPRYARKWLLYERFFDSIHSFFACLLTAADFFFSSFSSVGWNQKSSKVTLTKGVISCTLVTECMNE